jgi:ribosomal protein L14E/L6E/L27E
VPDGTINPGHIVISSAGRDAGHAYVVLGWYKPQTLLVADGRGRKVVSPKKKNVKHVKRHSIANDVVEALAGGLKITDEDIRQALAYSGVPR